MLAQIIVMLSGLLPRPELTMSMMGITFNIHALCFFAAHGLSGAASTRVGNELGKGTCTLAHTDEACTFRMHWRLIHSCPAAAFQAVLPDPLHASCGAMHVSAFNHNWLCTGITE